MARIIIHNADRLEPASCGARSDLVDWPESNSESTACAARWQALG